MPALAFKGLHLRLYLITLIGLADLLLAYRLFQLARDLKFDRRRTAFFQDTFPF